MKILIVGTVNGLQNEGMRNIATHLSEELMDSGHDVRETGLKDFIKVAFGALWADFVVVCARATSSVFCLVKFISFFNKKIAFLFVQRAENGYLSSYSKSKLKVLPLCIREDDLTGFKNIEDSLRIEVGINSEKFAPVSHDEATFLKMKYGLPPNLPVVIHVGHCSAGRGLEDFLSLDGDRYSRLIFASGMFEDESVKNALLDDGVKVVSEYNPCIQEIYQLADAYLFPTRSNEFVISVPLSVMESLSCGVPVIAYSSMECVRAISVNDDAAITYIDNPTSISDAVEAVLSKKQNKSFLANPKTWKEVAAELENEFLRWCKG